MPDECREYRCIGVPGAGKTTWLSRQARKAAAKYGKDRVVICSLTRAAAAEVGGRDTGIPPEHIATLHALCHRALGRPEIVEGKHVKEWNELHPGMPLSGDASGDVDDSKGGDCGGTLIEQSDLLRAQRAPRERWPKHLLVFDDAWKKFKEERSLCDFTDLIERGLHELPYAPGNPNVILGDECFVAGTMVLTDRGFVPIEMVNVEDSVLTHRGRWRRVAATQKRYSNTIEVVGQGHPGLRCTPGHLFWSVVKGSAPEWVDAARLTGRYWASPLYFPPDDKVPPLKARSRYTHGRPSKNEERIPVDVESIAFLWLVGRYLADGSVSSSRGTGGKINRVWWSIGARKAEAFRAVARSAGLSLREDALQASRACINFVLESGAVARWMEEHCKRGAHNKELPPWCLGLSEERRVAILSGYMAGDGALVPNQGWKATTVSWRLALGVKLLAQSLGYSTRLYRWDEKKRGHGWFQLVLSRTGRFTTADDLHRFQQVRSVSPGEESVLVYDLTVEEDSSFVADGIVVHNCQDWSRLEIDLVRKWSRETDHLVLCGDPLQALFAFRGSDPNILSLDGVPDSHIRVPREEDDIGERGRGWRASPQRSYRVPAELKTLARKVVSGLPGSEVDFISTEVEGSVHRAGFSFRAPERLGDVLPKLDGSVMILASCEHMLRPTEAWLRKEGVPYHNPYAKRWNPLRSTWKKIAGYVAPSAREGSPYERLSLDEVKAWAELLRAQDVFIRGGKTRILNASAEEPLSRLLPECFTEDAFDRLWDGDIEWFLAHADPSKGVAYPGAVLKRIGAESMMLAMSLPPKDRPFVTLGTMHSVKGGEADHVLVYPDIARASWEEAQRPGWSGVEATRRLFYVAITRAKKSLWIGQPDGKHFVRL